MNNTTKNNPNKKQTRTQVLVLTAPQLPLSAVDAQPWQTQTLTHEVAAHAVCAVSGYQYRLCQLARPQPLVAVSAGQSATHDRITGSKSVFSQAQRSHCCRKSGHFCARPSCV